MKSEEYVILNEDLVALSEARISVLDRGFLYGDGFFETLRVEKGHPLFLYDHIKRLYDSCSTFNISINRDLKFWGSSIERLVIKNNLGDRVAVAKIVVTRGYSFSEIKLPQSNKPTVVIYARPYRPHPQRKYEQGIRLSVFPHKRHTLLADHKTLNYLFYLTAKEWAKGEGSDEAIVLNGDGTISEGATTNIFYVKQNTVYKPFSEHYLKGVMEKQVVKIIKDKGIEVREKSTYVDDLIEADEVFLTNSLIEVMPAYSINHRILSRKGKVGEMLMLIDWKAFSEKLT